MLQTRAVALVSQTVASLQKRVFYHQGKIKTSDCVHQSAGLKSGKEEGFFSLGTGI
jgi:hypothetical protein